MLLIKTWIMSHVWRDERWEVWQSPNFILGDLLAIELVLFRTGAGQSLSGSAGGQGEVQPELYQVKIFQPQEKFFSIKIFPLDRYLSKLDPGYSQYLGLSTIELRNNKHLLITLHCWDSHYSIAWIIIITHLEKLLYAWMMWISHLSSARVCL